MKRYRLLLLLCAGLLGSCATVGTEVRLYRHTAPQTAPRFESFRCLEEHQTWTCQYEVGPAPSPFSASVSPRFPLPSPAATALRETLNRIQVCALRDQVGGGLQVIFNEVELRQGDERCRVSFTLGPELPTTMRPADEVAAAIVHAVVASGAQAAAAATERPVP